MNATAVRLGVSPLTIDWTGISKIPSGNGSAAGKSFLEADVISEAWNKLLLRFKSKEVGFFDAPIDSTISQINESMKEAHSRIDRNETRDVLFIGIGGSSLGPKAALHALSSIRKNPMRFHFMENPDASEWRETIRTLDPRYTLVVVVTKSGTTFETMSLFLLALEWLGKDRWKNQILAITDPVKGDLRSFAEKEKIPTLSIDPSIGGRFSLFSPVGLFAISLAGLSAEALLLGAKQVRDYVEKTPLGKNVFFTLGDLFIRHYEKRDIHVFFPYATKLRYLSDWFVQLWGESLGKDGKGFTPLGALGPEDQHSILQLLRDGPDNKLTFFVTIDEEKDPVNFPTSLIHELKSYPSFGLLREHSLGHLVEIEYQATSRVLTNQLRPHLSFRLDRLDERALGALCFALSCLTASTGALWGVDPFNQPGVEEGKVFIRNSLLGEKA